MTPSHPFAQWRPLTDSWTLRPADDTGLMPSAVADAMAAGIPATVPGCVHTDLLAAGLIPDPYLDENEAALTWIGRTDWRYETTFTWSAGSSERTDLVCEGLDTVARIEVNGTEVGSTRNMHRSYRFDLREHLRDGPNHLAVTFGSAQAYAERIRDKLGDLPGPNTATPEPFNFIRKMACNFGWDWGPILVTAGIWKPIGLESWSTARLAAVRPQVTVDGSTGRVTVDADLERAGSTGDFELAASVGGTRSGSRVTGGSGRVELEIENPELWWPHTYGEQPLYDLEVSLRDGDGTVLDTWHRRIGFRSVRLDTSPDPDGAGSAFTLVVNGRPIFARGANWIPDDCFPSRIGADRYRARLEQARDAHMDLLRIWGGGLYETEEFYAACDELGILVWQDFCFACAAYPEESPIAEEVEAEARENVTRLMPHPSLVLWNGNNENIWGYADWGWQDQLGDRTWGRGYYLDLLPRIVAEIDPTRPYWPGSPYSGSFDLHPNLPEHGCMHVWDVWNSRDYTAYREYVPRFVAEFGYQGPPTWATLTRAVHDDPLRSGSPGMLAHQKATGGNGKLATGLAAHFPAGADAPIDDWPVENWHYLTQVNQARALTLGIAHFRSHRGTCMGTIVWQLNDCWPVISWAAVDGDARRKPLWYALRRVYEPRLLTLQPRAGGLHAVAVSEEDEPWRSPLTVERRAFDGAVLAAWTTDVDLAGPGCAEVAVPERVATPDDPGRELLVASAGQPSADQPAAGPNRATWFFAEDSAIDYPSPAYDVRIRQEGSDAVVEVHAESLLRDLCLFADRLDPAAEVDDMLHTLLPGETVDLRVRGVTGLAAEQLVSPVLRCVNDAL